MLQIIFGDDEHTAADGPYTRVMKTRKWLYITSGAAVIVTSGLYDEAASKELLKVVSLPEWFIAAPLAFGLIYLTSQYGLLLYQLLRIHDLVMADRLQNRRVEELSAARERIKIADAELQQALNANSEWQAGHSKMLGVQKRIESEVEELAVMADRLSDGAHAELEQIAQRAATGYQELDTVKTALERHSQADPSGQLAELKSAAKQSRGALLELQNKDPANRTGYAAAEYLIDAARVLPPLAVSLYAAVRLLPLLFPGL